MESIMKSFLKAVIKRTRCFIASWPLGSIVQIGDIFEINKYDMNYLGNISKPPLNIAIDIIQNEIQSDVSWSPKLFFRLAI